VIDEQALDRALLRVCAKDGRTAGTGFFIDGDGRFLTCVHVVEGIGPVFAEGADGVCRQAAEIERWPEFDLALFRCAGATAVPLPLAARAAPARPFRTKGFQHQSASIAAALPTRGRIEGTTAVRYGPELRYGLDKVLVLGDATVDHGLSGAPLLDDEWDVVIGVVNSAFDRPGTIVGFALPLASAVASPSVRQLIVDNRALVPAYGPYLNAPAANAVCRRAVEHAIAQLETSDRLRLDSYAARPETASHVRSWLEGDAAVLPIVGPSGVGKTTELAQVGAALDQPAVFVAGAGLAETALTDGLQIAIEAELRAAASRQLPASDALHTVVEALAESESRLVVLLDGLNEAPAALRQNFKVWLAHTVEWLDETRARLMLTCRPEYWAPIGEFFPARLFGESAGKDRRSIELGDFTDAEAEEALRAYGLEGTGLSAGDVRHPFLARIYSEMLSEQGTPTEGLSRFDALARYVTSRARQVAYAVDSSVGAVEGLLVDAARDLVRRSLAIAPGRARQLRADAPNIFERLAKDNVLIELADGSYRFAFDEVAEFLCGRSLSDPRVDARFLLQTAARESETPLGAIVFALLALEKAEGSEALSDLLAETLDQYPPESFWLDFVLLELFESAHDQRALLDAIHRHISLMELDMIGEYRVERLLGNLRVAPAERLELLQRIAPTETGFDWESHHWDLSRFGPFSRIAAADIRADPRAAFRALIGWLDDERPLRGGDSKVADVARGLMYLNADAGFDDLCDVLADHGGDLGVLWRKLAERWPAEAISVCEEWGATPRRDADNARLAYLALAAPGLDLALRARAIEVLKRLVVSSDDSARATALEALAGMPDTRALVVQEVLDAFRAGDARLTSSAGRLLAVDFEAAFSALEAALRTGLGEDALWHLGRHVTTDEDEVRRIVELLERTWDPRSDLARSVALAVEARLGRLEATPRVAPRVLALADRVAAEGGLSARRPLTYFAGRRSSETTSELKDQVLATLIRTADGLDELDDILDPLDLNETTAWALDALLAREAKAPSGLERALLREAFVKESKAEAIAAAVERTGYKPRGELAGWLASIERGLTPYEAASAAVDTLIGR
jgi:hypothetical protein